MRTRVGFSEQRPAEEDREHLQAMRKLLVLSYNSSSDDKIVMFAKHAHRLCALHNVGETDSHEAEADACGYVPLRRHIATALRSRAANTCGALIGCLARQGTVAHQRVEERDRQKSLCEIGRDVRTGDRVCDPQDGSAQHARRQLPGCDRVWHREGVQGLLVYLPTTEPHQSALRPVLSILKDKRAQGMTAACAKARTMLKAMLAPYLRTTQFE